MSAVEGSSSSEGGRDYPAEFEAWWATYRNRNRETADYSMKKQIAFDAFYFAALQPSSAADAKPVADPTPEQLEPFARKWCIDNGIDPDAPRAPHGEWPEWYDACGPFAAMWRDISAHLYAQPSEQTGGSGEAWRGNIVVTRDFLCDVSHWLGEYISALEDEAVADKVQDIRHQVEMRIDNPSFLAALGGSQ